MTQLTEIEKILRDELERTQRELERTQNELAYVVQQMHSTIINMNESLTDLQCQSDGECHHFYGSSNPITIYPRCCIDPYKLPIVQVLVEDPRFPCAYAVAADATVQFNGSGCITVWLDTPRNGVVVIHSVGSSPSLPYVQFNIPQVAPITTYPILPEEQPVKIVSNIRSTPDQDESFNHSMKGVL